MFGLADAPREWYLRLARELKEEGWDISFIDGALWWFRDPKDPQKLKGGIVGHVDDLLFLGDSDAKASLYRLGDKLGFGTIDENDFQWCGKRIRRDPDTKELVVSMVPYHTQLSPVVIPRERRKNLGAKLSPFEVKKLKGILGSLQWLVAQLRFDIAFGVSSLQSETPTIGTMLRANKIVLDCKKDTNYELRFRQVDYRTGGVVSVTDAALGNVTSDGRTDADPGMRVHSQAAYAILLGDPSLVAGNWQTWAIQLARLPAPQDCTCLQKQLCLGDFGGGGRTGRCRTLPWNVGRSFGCECELEDSMAGSLQGAVGRSDGRKGHV